VTRLVHVRPTSDLRRTGGAARLPCLGGHTNWEGQSKRDLMTRLDLRISQ